MAKVRISEIFQKGKKGERVLVQGWVRTRRDSKELSFLEVNDGSCLRSLQVIVDSSLAEYQSQVLAAHTGSAVEIEGLLDDSPDPKRAIELKASRVTLVGSCDAEDYPLQKKRHSNEFLRTIAHLRPRTNTFGAVFRVRNAAAFAAHRFFQERGFLYIHTPIITTSDCEGAGTMFTVTALDLEAVAKGGQEGGIPLDFQQDFFAAHAGLTVSGQLEAETVASALSNVYTFGPTFRAENSNTPRHLAEFWMIEPEMAFCDLDGNMALAEEFTKYVLHDVLDSCAEDMAFFDQWVEKGIVQSLERVAQADFAHMTYSEAIAALEQSGRSFEYPVHWGIDLQTEHERYLTDEYVRGPVFVTNYPKAIKAFYMRLDADERTVSAMDLLVPRLGEIIGGSQREERENVLRRRIQDMGLCEEDYWWYLDLRRFGSVPHAGFGLGFERLIMYLTGMNNIRDVIPFPRTPGNASF